MRRALRAGAVVLAIQFAVLATLWGILVPWRWQPAEGPGFRCLLPWPGTPRPWSGDGWTGVQSDFTSTYRVASMPLQGPAAEAVDRAARQRHPRAVERREVPGVPGGLFLLSGRGKQWRATVLVTSGDRLLLAESEESRGNAAEPLSAVARLASRVEADGPAGPVPVADLESLEPVVGPAVDRHLVGMSAVLPILVVSLVPVLVLVVGLTAWSGRLPARPPGAPPPLLAEAGVRVVTGRGWRYRGTIGAALLDDRGFHLYAMGREVASVPSDRLREIHREAGTRRKRPFVVAGGDRPVRFAPDRPERWEAALGIRPGSPS